MKKQKRVFGFEFECQNKESPLNGCKIKMIFDGSSEEDEFQIPYDDQDFIEEDSDDE